MFNELIGELDKCINKMHVFIYLYVFVGNNIN